MKIFKDNGELLVDTGESTVSNAIKYCHENKVSLIDANLIGISKLEPIRSFVVKGYETLRYKEKGSVYMSKGDNDNIYEVLYEEYYWWLDEMRKDWRFILICVSGKWKGMVTTERSLYHLIKLDSSLLEKIKNIRP